MTQILGIIGHQGTGKTTLGKRLSLRWKVPHSDLDQLIEHSYECKKGAFFSIRDIFQDLGEAQFREEEVRVLLSRLADIQTYLRPHVLSFGGGALLAIEQAQKHALPVRLSFIYMFQSQASYSKALLHTYHRGVHFLPVWLRSRLHPDCLLCSTAFQGAVERIWQERHDVFIQHAYHIYDTDSLSLEEIEERVAKDMHIDICEGWPYGE